MHRLVLMSLAMVYAPLALGQEVVTDDLVGEEVSDEGLEDALEAPVDDTDEPDYFGLSVGIKGGASGNYLLPAEVGGISSSGALPFEDGGGGWGTAVGGYVEFRAIDQHLGLELNILGGSTKTWSQITYNGVVKTNWTYSSKNIRVPLLLEGYLGGRASRVSLGIGPEWVIGNSADFVVEVIEGQDYVDSEVEAFLSDSLTAAAQSHTNVTSNIGFEFLVSDLAITLDFRYSYNPSQPSTYLERMSVEGTSLSGVKASTNMDLHILLGLSYEFGFKR